MLHSLDYLLINEISRCGYVSPMMMRNYIAVSAQAVPETKDRRKFFKAFVDSLDLLKAEQKTIVSEETDTTASEGFFF